MRRGYRGFATAAEYHDFKRRQDRERIAFDMEDERRASESVAAGIERSGVDPVFAEIVGTSLRGGN